MKENAAAQVVVDRRQQCGYDVGRPAAIGTVIVFDFGVHR
jgi:hypothetical protein